MGGNALSSTSVRLTNKNYERVAVNCVGILQALYPQSRMKAIESYRSKSDHGDLDILITSEGFDPFKAAVPLEAVEVVRNGPVTSMGVLVRPEVAQLDGNVFQVDLITIPAVAFDYAFAYFSFNDLGNLIGRTAHAAGLTHRHDGLWYYFRDEDHKFREILLTRDYSAALTFLGYDAERFTAGFDTLEDIFLYVTGSAYFNRSIFLLENRNATARVRDRKRKTYTKFLQYCEVHPELPAFQYPENKLDWMPLIAAHFPHFTFEYDQAVADLAEMRAVKAKFNGSLVSVWTGFEGKKLGEFMAVWRQRFASSEELRLFVLGHDQDDLRQEVALLAESFKFRD